MKYPLYATPPRHTPKAERYIHTPLFISTVSKEIKNKKTWGLQDKCIYFQSTECSHIHLRILYPSTKLKQQDLLREASTHLLRNCALKNDCFSQRREKQQVIFLAYFFPQSRVKTSGMSLLGLYPQQIQKKKKVSKVKYHPR